MIANSMLIPKPVSDCPEKQFLEGELKKDTCTLGTYVRNDFSNPKFSYPCKVCSRVQNNRKWPKKQVGLKFQGPYLPFLRIWVFEGSAPKGLDLNLRVGILKFDTYPKKILFSIVSYPTTYFRRVTTIHLVLT